MSPPSTSPTQSDIPVEVIPDPASAHPLPPWATTGVQWRPGVPGEAQALAGLGDGLRDLASSIRGVPVQLRQLARETYYSGICTGVPFGLLAGLLVAAVLCRLSRRGS